MTPMIRAGFVLAVSIGCAPLGTVCARAASGTVDFSGAYSLKSVKGEEAPGPGDALSVQIVQTATEIKLTAIIDGHAKTEEFGLSDAGVKCKDSDGGDATCTAQWKGKTLVLNKSYTAHPTENGPDVEMHTRERLDLSSDRKTLMIRTDTKAPDYPALQMSDATTEVYTRN